VAVSVGVGVSEGSGVSVAVGKGVAVDVGVGIVVRVGWAVGIVGAVTVDVGKGVSVAKVVEIVVSVASTSTSVACTTTWGVVIICLEPQATVRKIKAIPTTNRRSKCTPIPISPLIPFSN
jgi:hypothetical protein